LAAAYLTALAQLVTNERLPIAALWSAPVAYAAAIVFSILRGRYYRRCVDRFSFVQREFFNVLYLTMAMAFVTDLLGFRIFTEWAQSAIWTVAASIVLFYIGIHGNVRATICGIIMIASLALANFMLPIAGYVLAGGFIVGYAGFGLVEIFARD
jgi:hypothetical protein